MSASCSRKRRGSSGARPSTVQDMNPMMKRGLETRLQRVAIVTKQVLLAAFLQLPRTFERTSDDVLVRRRGHGGWGGIFCEPSRTSSETCRHRVTSLGLPGAAPPPRVFPTPASSVSSLDQRCPRLTQRNRQAQEKKKKNKPGPTGWCVKPSKQGGGTF